MYLIFCVILQSLFDYICLPNYDVICLCTLPFDNTVTDGDCLLKGKHLIFDKVELVAVNDSFLSAQSLKKRWISNVNGLAIKTDPSKSEVSDYLELYNKMSFIALYIEL